MTFNPVSGRGRLVVSIVSHGHGVLVTELLQCMAALSFETISRVVLTINVPEAEPLAPLQGWPFALQIRHNPIPMGFGVNHNRALADAQEACVCVLNPDVRLLGQEPFGSLVQAALRPGVGCAYPEQVDATGQVQDSERSLPTPIALWHRHVLGRRDRRMDWVNAACLVMAQPIWQSLGGFDAHYFMYCEDVDLCLRMRLARLQLVRVNVRIVHAGQRASHRQLKHLAWHTASLLRLWRSPVYWQAIRLLPVDTSDARTISPP